MLAIASDTLPQTCLTYLAFRISFQETLERVALLLQMKVTSPEVFGYLTEVPFLREVPPRVQLDLLANTWQKHSAPQRVEADLVDESVVYAACETAAHVIDNEPAVVARYLRGGPLNVQVPADHYLASELRALHLKLSNDGDFLFISQFQDMDPDEAREMKRQFGLCDADFEPMFEVLHRWHVSPEFRSHLSGLLSPREIERVTALLGVR